MAMNAMPKARSGRKPRPKPPLDEARLQEMALAYVARFATSAARLEAYLARKLRERGWDGKGAPDLVAQLLDKLVENALDFAREGTAVDIRLTRGLGLTIARAIADFHQATVSAANRRDPEGVTVSVAFPLQARV